MASQRNHIDRITLFVVLILMVMSTFVVYSASSTWAMQKMQSSSGLVNKHIIKILIGLVAMFFAINIDYKKYKPLTKWVLIFSLLLLVATRVMGGEVKGAARWLSLGGFSLQPSEIAKFALLFHLSFLLSNKRDKLGDFKTGFMPLMIWISGVVGLVMIQPNFSTGALIFILGMILVFVGGARMKHVLLSLSALIPALLVYMVSAPYRMKRILSFVGFGGDEAVTTTANYQLLQGIIGFGNGGIFGVGMGMSKQRDLFLPESYGDFIFSIVGEEYGLIGTMIFMFLFLTILLRGLKIARYAPDDFGKYLAIGITSTVVVYALGNALVTLGLAPTTGLPMPFVSYGGSAIIFSSFAIGVLLNISSQTDLHPRERMYVEPTVSVEPAVSKIY
ncbi:MAG: putative peptidoglycan glycosyltransferase FtsW [Bacteroidota bacterium]|nr:putative peptidoglycan glycosyltransferase FtsW [Bacteroidota bacterium]